MLNRVLQYVAMRTPVSFGPSCSHHSCVKFPVCPGSFSHHLRISRPQENDVGVISNARIPAAKESRFFEMVVRSGQRNMRRLPSHVQPLSATSCPAPPSTTAVSSAHPGQISDLIIKASYQDFYWNPAPLESTLCPASRARNQLFIMQVLIFSDPNFSEHVTSHPHKGVIVGIFNSKPDLVC